MSTIQGGRTPVERIRIHSAARIRINKAPPEPVGYRSPPPEHQWKPGQSGFPSGRPKGAKNESTILRDLLNRKIEIRDRGRLRKITIREAILRRIIEDSLKGNTKSAAFILNRHAAMESGEGAEADISDDDREILDAYVRRLEAQRPSKKESS